MMRRAQKHIMSSALCGISLTLGFGNLRGLSSCSSLGKQPESRSRGAFIVLEGVDRCGKTTQVQRLVDRLNQDGKKAVVWRFPDRTTTIGKMINSYLQNSSELDDQAVHLLFSANRWEKVSELEETLHSGTTVVCDRYVYSGVAFTSAKPGFYSNESLQWCRAPDAGLPQPDAVAYLTVPPAAAEKRGGFGSERYETTELQAKVRRRFAELKDADDAAGALGSDGAPLWRVVRAEGSMEQVEDRVWGAVGEAVLAARRGGRPVPEQLWCSGNGVSVGGGGGGGGATGMYR